jgi:serine/threonine-protein kinase PknK
MDTDAQRGRRPALIATKYRAPSRLRAQVARARLLEQLDARRECRLTLIHAPAGFGKTTLALQWRERLQQRGAAAAWLSLSADDANLDRFLIYLVQAVREAEPSIKLDVAALLEARAGQTVSFVLAALVEALDACRQPVYIFLDDWHLVSDSRVQDVITFLLDLAPQGTHLVIMSREQPGLPLARLRVSDQLAEFRIDDLRFNLAESQEFLRGVNALRLDDHAVRSLWQSTDGWVAALQLASLSLRGAKDTEPLVESFTGRHQSIGAYLAENVLDNLPPPVLDFLMATSILDRLCAGLCDAVTGAADSQAMLESLRQQNMFLQPLDEVGTWFRYHHLFADYLRLRMERSAPERLPALHRRASTWYAEHGPPEQAVTHALAAGEMPWAVELVERDAMWLVEHSYMATLRLLVQKLPDEALQARPRLLLAIAWAHCLTHRRDEARAALERAMSALGTSGLSQAADAAAEAHAEGRVVEAGIRIYQDCIDGVEALVQPCIERAAQFRPWVVAVAANILTYVRLQQCDYDEALRLQAWARSYQDRAQGPFSGIYGRFLSGIAALELGRMHDGAEYFRDGLRKANSSIGHHSHAARLAAALLGQAMVERNRLDEAERLLEDSRDLGLEGGIADCLIATYVASSRLLAQRGDAAGAAALLDEGDEAAQRLGLVRLEAALVVERMRALTVAGELGAAGRLAQRCGLADGARRGESARALELRRLALARLRAAEGRVDEGLRLVEPMLDTSLRQKRRTFEVAVRLVMTQLLLARHDEAGAQQMLARALMVGLRAGLLRSFLDEGPAVLARIRQLHGRLGRLGADDYDLAAVRPALEELLAAAGDVASEPERALVGIYGEELRQRETEILRLLDEGMSNKEIARRLAISIDTVKWYLKAIYAKLGVTGRSMAVHEARRSGLFP